MPRTIHIAAATLLALTACGSAASAPPRQEPAQGVKIGEVNFAPVYKFCDAGRAIYVARWGETSIFVIDAAPECEVTEP